MKQQRKIIHVELYEPYQGKNHYFFGSVAAIYEILPRDIIGLSKDTLWGSLKNGGWKGRKAKITQDILHSKTTNRGIKKGGNND
nr:MAG TPA: hypothetical protein [Caudoviricetes sp.]